MILKIIFEIIKLIKITNPKMYPTKTLWEICEIKTWKKDANYSTDDWKYPFFTCWREILKSPWYSFDTDAILIAWNWDVWACKKFKWKFEAYQRTYVLDNFQNIEKNFLFYFLDWNLKKELLNETLWSAIPYIKLWSLQNREIPLPPLPTQQKIVFKLDYSFEKLDQATTLTKQNLANIEELNKSVLEKIFKECEEKYEKRKLGEVCNKITDWSHNPPKWIETWYPMISARNLTDFNEIIFDNLRFLSENDYLLENKRTDVKDWDILLSIVWTIWKVCIVKEKYWKFVMQRSLAVLKLNKNLLNSKFVYFYLKSDFAQKFLNNSANWATQKWIYLKDLKQIIIPLPPLSEQQKIVEYLDNIFAENQKLKNLYQAQIKNLNEMKQSFLKKAFAGELV